MTAVALAAPLLAVIALDDVRHHRIRNRHVAALGLMAIATIALDARSGDQGVVPGAVAGALLAAGPLAAAWTAQPARIGGGDVKLAAVLGALLGALHPWLALTAIGLGLIASLLVTLVTRTSRVALAPSLCGATALVASLSLVSG